MYGSGDGRSVLPVGDVLVMRNADCLSYSCDRVLRSSTWVWTDGLERLVIIGDFHLED